MSAVGIVSAMCDCGFSARHARREEEPHDLVLSKDGRTLFVVIPQQRVLKLKRVVRPSRRLREMYVRKITELNDREVVTDVYRTGWSVMPAAPRKYTVLDYPKQDLNFV
eukprot:INCI10421.1.p1 GENE.INCI10421.1~~INCI10421.1.p1  ORF type:complete len:109 (+),score=8.63 INCI10421.1:89-415(+)